MSRILLDTNVLVYAVDKSSKYHHWSKKFFSDEKYDCCTTSKNLSEFLVVTTRGEEPLLSTEDAVSDVRDFRAICTVLYPDPLSTDLYTELCSQHQIKGLAIHDCEIASIGLSNQVNQIATVNKKDFRQIDELTVVSPD